MPRLAGISHKEELKTMVANFPSKAVKLYEGDENQRKQPGDPKITRLIHKINKLVQTQAKKLFCCVQTLAHRDNCSKVLSTVKRTFNKQS